MELTASTLFDRSIGGHDWTVDASSGSEASRLCRTSIGRLTQSPTLFDQLVGTIEQALRRYRTRQDPRRLRTRPLSKRAVLTAFICTSIAPAIRTFTLLSTRLVARAGNLSNCSSARRNSIAAFRPSA